MFDKLMRAMYWKTGTGKWDKQEITTDLAFGTLALVTIAVVVWFGYYA